MKKILIASKSFRAIWPEEELKNKFAEIGFEADTKPFAQASYPIAEYDCIVAGTDHINKEVMDAAKNLKAVIKFGVGLDGIDTEYAKEKGIAVGNLPAVNSNAVAEFALSLTLSLTRRVTVGDREVKNNNWPRLLGSSLRGKTIGILGTGNIGCTLAHLLSGFNVKILGYDMYENDRFKNEGGTYSSLENILESADIISIHLPLLDSTRHLISENELNKMKKSSLLINTARGGLVDEDALYKALTEGKIAGAALDVLEHEPAIESPLIKLDNVIVTPHIAAYDDTTLNEMGLKCVETVKNMFIELGE